MYQSQRVSANRRRRLSKSIEERAAINFEDQVAIVTGAGNGLGSLTP